MSNRHRIRCLTHDEECDHRINWGGPDYWRLLQVRDLVVLAQRLVAEGTDGAWHIELESPYTSGAAALGWWLMDHARCDLAVFDEYGDQVAKNR
jgi:hypothetical protein